LSARKRAPAQRRRCGRDGDGDGDGDVEVKGATLAVPRVARGGLPAQTAVDA